MLEDQDWIGELTDPDSAANHTAQTWGDEGWRTNLTIARQRLPKLVGRVLATGSLKPKLEELGLVEVHYPGLEPLPIPEGFGSRIGSDRLEAQERWVSFLAACCDAMRRQRFITLGDDGLDLDQPFGALGRWIAATQGETTFVGTARTHARRWLAQCLLGTDDSASITELLTRTFEVLRDQQTAVKSGHRADVASGVVPTVTTRAPQETLIDDCP